MGCFQWNLPHTCQISGGDGSRHERISYRCDDRRSPVWPLMTPWCSPWRDKSDDRLLCEMTSSECEATVLCRHGDLHSDSKTHSSHDGNESVGMLQIKQPFPRKTFLKSDFRGVPLTIFQNFMKLTIRQIRPLLTAAGQMWGDESLKDLNVSQTPSLFMHLILRQVSIQNAALILNHILRKPAEENAIVCAFPSTTVMRILGDGFIGINSCWCWFSSQVPFNELQSNLKWWKKICLLLCFMH